MNTFKGTFDDVQEITNNYNSDNTLNLSDIVSNTLNKFKSKVLGILGTKKAKETKKEKINNIFLANNTKNVFLSSEERKSLFNRYTRNAADISKLKKELKGEQNLLSHFEMIRRFIPGGAEKTINSLKTKITNIEDLLIKLELENIKINSKLNPFDKDNKEWDENIFNPENRDKYIESNIYDKLTVNISRLENRLSLEKKLLKHYEELDQGDNTESKNNNLGIDISHFSEISNQMKLIKDIEDKLITLRIKQLKMTKKV